MATDKRGFHRSENAFFISVIICVHLWLFFARAKSETRNFIRAWAIHHCLHTSIACTSDFALCVPRVNSRQTREAVLPSPALLRSARSTSAGVLHNAHID